MKRIFCYVLMLGLIIVPSAPGYALWKKEKTPPKYSDLKAQALAAIAAKDYKSAEGYMKQALAPSQNEYGLESAESAECLGLLGAIYYEQGLTVQGEEFHDLAREIRAKLDQATVIEGLEREVFGEESHPGKAEIEAAQKAAEEMMVMELKQKLNYRTSMSPADSRDLMDSMESMDDGAMPSMPDTGAASIEDNLVDEEKMSPESQP